MVVVCDVSQQVEELRAELENLPVPPPDEPDPGEQLQLVLRLLELTQAPGGREEVEGWIQTYGELRVRLGAKDCKEKNLPPPEAYPTFLSGLKEEDRKKQEKEATFLQEVMTFTKAKKPEVQGWIEQYGKDRLMEVVYEAKNQEGEGKIKVPHQWVKQALTEGWKF